MWAANYFEEKSLKKIIIIMMLEMSLEKLFNTHALIGHFEQTS